MADFFAELKRRHIYRVGAAYVVVAWALTQLVEILAQVFTLPLWIAQTAIVLLAIGFPAALIAAWVIENKPHQAMVAAVRSKPTVLDWGLFGAIALLIAVTGYQTSVRPAAEKQAGVEAAREAAASPATAVSVAVLPFANLSGDANQEFFSDGITEEITGALTKVPDLRVVARTSAFEFKGQNRNVQSIGQQLQATHLIEGSVRKAGERVRITAQLINTNDGTHVWAENYDRELTDIFAIQEDIARSIAASLRMSLGLRPGEQLVSNRSIDPASYEQFLRGKMALARARNAFDEQLALLEPVVAKNPDYAPAWAALARAYRFATIASRSATRERSDDARAIYEPKMLAAAKRAVELDENLVEGQVALALTQSGPRRLILAEDILSRALALDPNHPEALNFYSGQLVAVGRVKEGLALQQRLSQIEPYIPLFVGNLGDTLWLNGQTDAAIVLFKANLNRQGVGAGMGLARIYASLGRYDEAADYLSTYLSRPEYRDRKDIREVVSAGVTLLRSAPNNTAPERLPRLADVSFIYLYVGAPERSLEPFEQAITTQGEMAFLWHPSYAPVRKTDRFKKVVSDLGLVNYWRERGWPEFCHSVGADDFECT